MIRVHAAAWPIAAVLMLAIAAPAHAHGLGGRLDLPIPIWQFAWAAAFAVLVSFAVLGRYWTYARLAPASRGLALPPGLERTARRLLPIARLIGLAMLAVTVYAAFWGNPDVSSNLAPFAAFVLVWVGVAVASAFVGDLWATVNPFATLADLGGRVRRSIRPDAAPAPAQAAESISLLGIVVFLWMELAFHLGAAPRTIGTYLVLYASALVAGAMIHGPAWARQADGFAALFRTISALAPLHRDAGGTLRLRYPVTGLARMSMGPGTLRLVLVVIGATTFDGFSRSSLWLDITSNRSGWELTAVNSGGLIFGIGVVMALYRAAIAGMARVTGEPEHELGDLFGPSLVPIMVAYTVAHYFSFLVFEGQNLIRLASDPYGLGWNLFGTAGWRVDYTILSTGAIAWTQTLAIAVGHMLAVLVAHDRALERLPSEMAIRSQYPMLAAMIAFTIGGLLLLLG